MRIKLRTTNFEHTPAIDTLAEEKLVAPTKKILGDIDDRADILFDIEFELTTHHHRNGAIWRAEAQLEVPHIPQLTLFRNTLIRLFVRQRLAILWLLASFIRILDQFQIKR